MSRLIAKEIFRTKGVGVSKEKLASFEEALQDAGISHLNLVYVSSIVPPGCKVISKSKGIKKLIPGEIAFCVLSRNQSNENRRLISASIGVAIPADKASYGYISEHHGFGQNRTEAGDYAGISGKIVRTVNITQTAYCKRGVWTTVVSAAMFIFEP
jgi:arginine decarboxylase